MAGKGVASPLEATRHQLIWGDDAYVEQYHQTKTQEELRELSKAHRRFLASKSCALAMVICRAGQDSWFLTGRNCTMQNCWLIGIYAKPTSIHIRSIL
jgi:hypothetical protein